MLKDHHWYTLGVLSVSTVVVIIIAAFVFMNFSAIKTALTPVPENFTELYFEDHLNLPKRVTQGESKEIRFSIHNVEHRQMTYSIRVTMEDATRSALRSEIMHDSVTLAPDETKTIPFSFSVPISESRRDKVVVTLENLDQTIHFWIQSNPPVGSSSAVLAPLSQ